MPSRASRAFKASERFSRTDGWMIGLIAVILLAVYLPTYRTGGWTGKEGISLYGSHLVTQGEVPYRDFDSFYAPLPTYLNALIFRIGGGNIDCARLVLLFALVLNAIALYLLARRLMSPIQAGLMALIGVAYYSFPPHNYSTLYASFFSLCTLLALAHALESGLTPGRAVWIGAGTGVTSVTHHPIAVFLALTVVVSAALAPFLRTGRHRRGAPRDLLPFLGIFVLVTACIALPVYGTFASLTSWGGLIRQLFPRQISGELGSPFPPLGYLVPHALAGKDFFGFCASAFFYGSLFLVIGVIVVFLREIVRPSGAPVQYLLPLTVYQIFMETKIIALGSANLLYTQAAFVLAGYWAFRSRRPVRRWIETTGWVIAGGWLILEIASWAVTPLAGRAKPVYRIDSGHGTVYLSAVLGRETHGLMRYIEKNAKSNDPVAILPEGTFLSLLTGRPNPFRTTIYDSSLLFLRTPESQKKMTQLLEAGKVPYIVILEWGEGYYLRFTAREMPIFSRYLAAHYAMDKTIGTVKPPLLSFVAHVYKRTAPSE